MCNKDWIPCSDRLPNDKQWVLCQTSSFFDVIPYHILQYREYVSGNLWMDEQGNTRETRRIVAWMPLPRLLEEVRNGKRN